MEHKIGTTTYEFDIPTSFCSVWDVFVQTGFTISLHWNQEPGWFFKQPKELQAQLIAHYNLTNTKTDELERKKKRYNISRIKKAQAKYLRRGTDGG